MKTAGTTRLMTAVVGFVVMTGLGVRAQTEGLQLVPPALVPEGGTF